MIVEKKELWETRAALDALANIEGVEDEKLAYKIGRIHDAAQSVLKPLLKSHDKLVKKYGEELTWNGQATGQWQVPSGTPDDDEFQENWESLLAEDAQVKIAAEVDYKRITLEQLKPVVKKLKPRDLGALSRWLIEPMKDE